MLTACMMVRRLKKDVLSQLPPKRRTQVTPPPAGKLSLWICRSV